MYAVGGPGTTGEHLSGSQEGNQMTIGDALDMYLKRREKRAAKKGLHPKTVKVLRWRLEGFFAPCLKEGLSRLHPLLPGLIEAYGKSHATITVKQAVGEAKKAT